MQSAGGSWGHRHAPCASRGSSPWCPFPAGDNKDWFLHLKLLPVDSAQLFGQGCGEGL